MKIAERWQHLNAHAAPHDSDAATIRERYRFLDRLCTAAGRSYHTWRHIAECLEWLDRYAGASALAQEARWRLEYALFYHDAIYETQRDDNEERSAALAEQELTGIGLPEELIRDVTTLILATRHLAGATRGGPRAPSALATRLSPIMSDIDLAILGANRARFDEYDRQIRVEYSHVDAQRFRTGRRRRLRAFLERDAIYSTTFFASRLEAAARANIERILDRFYSDSSHGYT